MRPVVVSYCFASANIAPMPELQNESESHERKTSYDFLPIPESKSGTIAAKVTIRSCTVLRRSLHCTRSINTFDCEGAGGISHSEGPLGRRLAGAIELLCHHLSA
jgi:hypothetical protein